MKKKIYVLDDNKPILDCIKIILEEENYKVTTMESGKEFYKKIQKELPDLIFLDLWLQDSKGEDILKKLKETEKTKNIPVVLISALSTCKQVAKNLKAEVCLTKPFNIDDVLRITSDLTNKRLSKPL